MTSLRAQIENLLAERRQALATGPDDALDGAVRKSIEGALAVVSAAKAARDKQKAYFKARKAGLAYDASRLLEESKQAEAELDKVVRYWLEQLQPPNPQQTLF